MPCSFVFGKLGRDSADDGPMSPTKGTVKSTASVAETTSAEMAAEFVSSARFSEHFWSSDERCISVLMHKLKSAKQTCTDILSMVGARAQMEDDLGKRLAKASRSGLGTEEVGGLKESLRTVRAELEANSRAHLDLAKQLRAEVEKPLATFIADQRAKRRGQTSVIQKTEGDRNTLRSQVRKLQDKRRVDTKKVGDLDLQCNGIQQSAVDPKLRTKLERAQMQQRTTEADYADARARLKEADRQWFNVWRSACDVFQVLEEERVEYLKTCLWTYTNLVSTSCVADDESMERIRQDLEKISVADDIALFIETFGTGEPDPALRRHSTARTDSKQDDDDSDSEPKPAARPPVDQSTSQPPPSQPSPMQQQQQQQQQMPGQQVSGLQQQVPGVQQQVPGLQQQVPGSQNGYTGSETMSTGTGRSSLYQPQPNAYSNGMHEAGRPGSVHAARAPVALQQDPMRPQTRESMRPASMHGGQMPPQHMASSWNGARPTSAMHGAMPADGSFRRASNNDMYGGSPQQPPPPQPHPQPHPQYVQRTNSQHQQQPMYANGMYADPRAPSSMGAYQRPATGTSSPVPMQRPGTPSQMMHNDMGYGSPRSRAGSYAQQPPVTHTGNFGTLAVNTQIPQYAQQQQASSAPGSPYQNLSRPGSSAGMHSGSPSRPVSVMQQQQQQPYGMAPAYRSATPVQQQPSPQQQQYMMNRPPTQMSHSPVPPQMAPSPQMQHQQQHQQQRAPSAVGYAPPQPQPQPVPMQQQRPMSRVEPPSVAEGGKEILFYVKVLYDYDADNDKELSIREGDVISVLAVSADGWWEGELTDRRTGRPLQGTFPSNFTDPIANLAP
ncbi:formin-binding protein [Coemansia sp. RSA 552]|nr:formin-binding protein [Coemansia sp. RSA 552]